jgi:hypothetical protein
MADSREPRVGCVIPCSVFAAAAAYMMYPWYGDSWLFILAILFVLFVAGLQWGIDRYRSRPSKEKNSN